MRLLWCRRSQGANLLKRSIPTEEKQLKVHASDLFELFQGSCGSCGPFEAWHGPQPPLSERCMRWATPRNWAAPPLRIMFGATRCQARSILPVSFLPGLRGIVKMLKKKSKDYVFTDCYSIVMLLIHWQTMTKQLQYLINHSNLLRLSVSWFGNQPFLQSIVVKNHEKPECLFEA